MTWLPPAIAPIVLLLAGRSNSRSPRFGLGTDCRFFDLLTERACILPLLRPKMSIPMNL